MKRISAFAGSAAVAGLLGAITLQSGPFVTSSLAQTSVDPLVQDQNPPLPNPSTGQVGTPPEFNVETPSLQDRLRNPRQSAPESFDQLRPFESPGVGTGTGNGSGTLGSGSTGVDGSGG